MKTVEVIVTYVCRVEDDEKTLKAFKDNLPLPAVGYVRGSLVVEKIDEETESSIEI